MNKKILIVEDDESIAEIQKDYLEMSGYSVRVISSGYDGVKVFESEEFDLVILDLMLPGIDGFEILKRISKIREVPIIIVSAKHEEMFKIKGLGLGADDYMTKPFSGGELVARVNSHLKKYDRLKKHFGGMKDKTKMLRIRGLEIDIESRRALVNGQEIFLTQKEFDLLVFLIENPNRVYDKETLFEKVWGLDALSDASTITVHVARIREKIEMDPSKPQYIETVWGAGYRFKL
jgi:DNA-binding response OmpR family regulator